MRKIIIPIKGKDTELESPHCFVIVGANGSGKSRLGAWIEKQKPNEVLRISAQRALSIPEVVTIKSEESSFRKLQFGNEEERNMNKAYKWGQDEYTTRLINDYDSVLSAVFARNNKENTDYVKNCKDCERQGINKPQTPITIIESIEKIWRDIFPYRVLRLDDAQVKAELNGVQYHGKNMSDGERVAIYLIGQCLVAPDNITLVIDEPEIHLHKSIMNRLWDKIEEYCPNKTIVYITHDLDFASSRKDSRKIWVKSYDNDIWDIEVLNDNEIIPDSLMIEVLGNRKNVLFVEGERGSYDYQLYTHIYKDYHVIPRNNCRTVIESTKAFNDIKSIHNLDIKGIIDRDYMTEEEIQSYLEQGIYTIDVAEIENLYLLEGIMKIIAEYLVIDNHENLITKIKEKLFEWFQSEFDVHLVSICEREIRHKLNCYKKNI